jgi:hypothetical protein
MEHSVTIKAALKGLVVAAGVLAATSSAQAGNIVLSGHDILLHGGGDGYDGVILDYLRGDIGSGPTVAKAGYSIAIVGSDAGFASFSDSGGSGNFTGAAAATGNAIALTGTLAGYSGAKYYNTDSADWSSVLANDALIILSHTNCGGCDLSTAGSAVVNANSAAIATAFNAGMDIWGGAGANLGTYYDFLPAGVVATGASISGSDFTATPAGVGLGITAVMTDGDATHNRFTSQAAAFTVLECRTTACTEVVTIGAQNVNIGGGGLTPVAEPGTLALFGLGLAGLGFARRRKVA